MIDDINDDIPSSPIGEELAVVSQRLRVTPDEPDETSPIKETEEASYLTKTDFNYSMNILDKKIISLYKLCRFTADQQQEMAKSMKKLVALDELSEDFWNVSYLI